jgi:hypothetical protein
MNSKSRPKTGHLVSIFFLAILAVGSTALDTGAPWWATAIIDALVLLFIIMYSVVTTDEEKIHKRFLFIGKAATIYYREIVKVTIMDLPENRLTAMGLSERGRIMTIRAADGRKISMTSKSHNNFEDLLHHLQKICLQLVEAKQRPSF